MYDSAGSYRLIVGSEANRNYPEQGWLWYFNNIDGNLGGNFTLVDSLYQNIWEGQRMTVNGKDINSDGSMDWVIGNYCGGVALYLGDTNATGLNELSSRDDFDFSIYPNPSNGMFNVKWLMANGNTSTISHQPSTIEIYNVLGGKVFDLTIEPSNHTTIAVSLPSGMGQGIYFCKVSGVLLQSSAKDEKKFTRTKKLIILK